jgi:multiple sugar transport system substrate-binding protein
MRKNKFVYALIGMLVITAMVLPAISCSSGSSSTTATSSAVTTTVTSTQQASTVTTTKTSATTVTSTATTVAGKKFGLADIPEISNKRGINVITESGAFCDKIFAYMKKFSEKTGVPVTIDPQGSIVIYSKEMPEIKGGTGFYDILYIETAWTAEMAAYTYKTRDLANKFDPGGWDAAWADISMHAPAMQRVFSDMQGEVHALPYYCYDMSMWIRQDVFDDPTEQELFKAKYGYNLTAATTDGQLLDQGEFFTRKTGEELMGKKLDKDIFGFAMMAGAYQINDETSSRIWGKGGDYATPIRDANGKVTSFVITKKDKQILKEVMTEYRRQLQFASPGCLTANYDFPCAQFAEGRAIIQPTQFVCVVNWAIGDLMKTKMPDARVGFYPTIGNRPYTGCWTQGVSLDSKNPEAAYWLSRYLGSYEVQMDLTLMGWSATRTDVLSDPIFQTPAYIYPGGLVNKYCLDIWAQEVGFADTRYYFNSDAGGKVYEMQMNVLAKSSSGEKSVDDTIAELVQQTLELQTKFGSLPITEEK